ncbi:hypothetical protein Pyn_31764 [Prunus yedoensis var. nudiflora]|uniref:Uncharacterized protein n=1 Tax=Prunus yedoensis var. nudiflora TaxID=2094558 RepID=A0A314UDV1_PRUYE|nr:hypothetical protein Pyn_31764 [Prunus yedoensis var. nudiflora]
MGIARVLKAAPASTGSLAHHFLIARMGILDMDTEIPVSIACANMDEMEMVDKFVEPVQTSIASSGSHSETVNPTRSPWDPNILRIKTKT